MPKSKAYERGYQKAKFMNNGGPAAATNRPATGSTSAVGTTTATSPQSQDSAVADRIAAERGNVQPTAAAFETEVDGKNYQFNPSEAPPDAADFYQGEKVPVQGDMVSSNDGFLYAYAGPALGEEAAGMEIGWYRSQGAFHGEPA